MFGLDARIALAIFAVLSVVAGTVVVMGMDTSRAQALAQELSETGKAVESLCYDIRADLYPSLMQPSPKNAFTALFDKGVMRETDSGGLRGRWLGPYVHATSTHSRYGEMMIEARKATHADSCVQGEPCFLWITYATVKKAIAQGVNSIIDGDHETDPEKTGRVQWVESGEGTVTLSYQAAKTLSYTGDSN
jgi:hypothetical protein